MAQGTGDKRFLARSAKTASAGVILALAVAAFLLAGCGGGSSDTASSSTPSSDTTTAGSDSGSGASSPAGSGGVASSGPTAGATAGAGAPSTGGATGGGSGSAAAAGGGGSSSGSKHGRSVPQPSGEPAPKITPQQRREATVADMSLQSPSSQQSGAGPPALPAEYTCDGKSTSPALSWQGVPDGTAELALFAMNVQPVEGKLFFDWAVAGLSPELGEIEAGKLPKGAVTGRNSFGKTGYEICPESGETYMFALFALPKKLSPGQGFDPLELRKAVADTSGNVGLLALSYARG